MVTVSRSLGDLAFVDVSQSIRAASVLCLPIGAIEQHGPHLPLNTDVIVAEEIAAAIVARWGDAFDLWLLPTIPISLSHEHDWAPGTLCLSVQSFVTVMKDLAGDIVRSLPARNLLIINGHGGNRRVLEGLIEELRADHELNVGVLHPFDLSKVRAGSALPDVHAGWGETSVMLAVAPHLVRRDRIKPADPSIEPGTVRAIVMGDGSAPQWRSDDPRISDHGVIGDAHEASAEHGRAIIDSIVDESRTVLGHLIAQPAGRT
jgi:creatinine amidohydrolase/Fe(II)-dependent formamide hydrolase-like protein